MRKWSQIIKRHDDLLVMAYKISDHNKFLMFRAKVFILFRMTDLISDTIP